MRSADVARARRPAALPRGAGTTIVVMYHYVCPVDRARRGGLFPLEPEEFEAQLDFLADLGTIIHPDAIDGAAESARPRIVLTFDDGTRDHYATVFPILRRRGLSGLFGLISGPGHCGVMPNPHLIHWLTSHRDDASIWTAMSSRFGEAALGDPRRARTLYARDAALRARIKFALNFVLDYDAAQEFLADQVRALGVDPQALAREWFIDDTQAAAMHRGGMVLAVHAHRHRPYAGPAKAYFDAELEPCERWLASLTGVQPRHYIAAFGGSSATGESAAPVAGILAARGYHHGYSTAVGVASAPPAGFMLPRVDCAGLPPRNSIRHLELLLTGATALT